MIFIMHARHMHACTYSSMCTYTDMNMRIYIYINIYICMYTTLNDNYIILHITIHMSNTYILDSYMSGTRVVFLKISPISISESVGLLINCFSMYDSLSNQGKLSNNLPSIVLEILFVSNDGSKYLL